MYLFYLQKESGEVKSVDDNIHNSFKYVFSLAKINNYEIWYNFDWL